ncbi:MAG: hypothetical protein QOD86_3069 [Miltoncostaeaceae bacterium]|nr:hypothetical protein [Miltoncostaeaceae bacterium]
MRRLAALAALAALMVAPAGAAALPLLAPADAEELAATLAEAEEAQGICYSWYIEVEDHSGGPSGVDAGSSRGVGHWFTAYSDECERIVALSGRITYTSESSESEDSAGIAVATKGLADPVTSGDLERLGLTGGDLLGGGDDTSLINMVGALPLLAAESGAAPYVPYEANTAPLMPGEHATGSPGNDWWRKFWPYVLVAAALCGLAGSFIGFVIGGGLRARREGPSTARPRHIRARPLP